MSEGRSLSVALIGAGAMGGALLRGWLARGVVDARASALFDPAPGEAILAPAKAAGLSVNPPPGDHAFDGLVIAVKPQAADTVLREFENIAEGALVISVMAGRSLASLLRGLPRARAIIRAMPNLPAAIGAGVTALYAPQGVGDDDRAAADALMGAVGETAWVDSEQALDAATAVSGSGPAYFFLMAEALEDAALAAGLPRDVAARLARATCSGAGAYAASDPRALADLRRAVTSPGGTTEAALAILDGDEAALRRLMKSAVERAMRRAAELRH